jgi:ATP-dependent DNA helicase
MNEFRHWCPSIPTVQFHGVPEERAEIARTKIFPYLKGGRPAEKFPVVITSYEMVLKERSVLGKINWEFIIVDEGHRLKNFDSMLFRELKQFQSATRLLITGTPLQNNLKELWALLNFLMPTIFKDWEAFESWFDFGDLADDEDANAFLNDNQKKDLLLKIHTVLQPMILRRVKKDVAAYLPKKREYLLHAPMTREQTDLYNVLSDKTQDTRSYLENKIVERLTRSTNSPASPGMSATTSRNASVSPKLELGHSTELAMRPSPHKGSSKKCGSPASTASVTNAFSKMMATATAAKRGRGRPRTSTAVSTETTDTEASVKTNSKRKTAPTIESPASKSAKSSRQSTPASSVRRGTRRRHILRDDDPDEDDLLDDDEFETKLLKEAAKNDAYAKLQDEPDLSPDELARTKTLDLAKKEIQQKKFGNPMMQLRKICNSPHLFYNPWPTSDDVDETLVTSSGKMLMLDRLLPTLFAKGHKVLIFSQFVEMINLIEDYCRVLRGWDTCRIVGDVSQADRAEQIERFNNDPDVKIFLLTTRAGGQGINLASADTVVLFDSDWNPQQDLQAQDRAHRIGQTRPVIVFRLATKNTVEEGLLMSAEGKRRLEKLVIKKGNIQTMMGRGDDVTADDLKRLLLKDGEVYKFSGHKEILSDQDLEVLCDRYVFSPRFEMMLSVMGLLLTLLQE